MSFDRSAQSVTKVAKKKKNYTGLGYQNSVIPHVMSTGVCIVMSCWVVELRSMQRRS